MPSLEWNKQHWTASLALHHRDRTRAYAYGDQWGTIESYPPLQAVRDAWLLPFVGPDRTILEIGTGGGRWTQFLLDAATLYSVDINPVMLDYAAHRFGRVENLRLLHTDGTSLPGIAPGSLDFVFSFGTFVHIDAPQIAAYLRALRPLLRPSADVVLHYADKTKPTAAQNIHFAHTDALLMETLLCGEGYRVIRHETGLIHHSNLVHFRPAPEATPPAPWPLATHAPIRLLAWPDYRSPEELLRMFQLFGPSMAGRAEVCLCLFHDPASDLPAADVSRVLQEAFSLTLRDGPLDILLLDEALSAEAWPALGAAVTASLDLPSARWGRRAALLSAVGVPRVRSAAELARVIPT